MSLERLEFEQRERECETLKKRIEASLKMLEEWDGELFRKSELINTKNDEIKNLRRDIEQQMEKYEELEQQFEKLQSKLVKEGHENETQDPLGASVLIMNLL